ncbi:MAG: DNA-binding XRE family transcriptional regulator [Oleiphilaceae bacterium]|jgi:DNA-binding XRE family transcriptional regulator
MERVKYLDGPFLRKMRLEKGHTTVKMAKIAGVKTRKTYENWEKNIGEPSVNQMIEMIIGYDLSPSAVIKEHTTI